MESRSIGVPCGKPEGGKHLQKLKGKLEERIYRSTMTPAIGTHTGLGLFLVAVLGDKQ